MKNKAKILIVDEDAPFIGFLEHIFGKDFIVHNAKNATEALNKLSKINYNLIISEIILPGMDGLHLLEKVRLQRSGTDVIFCTSFSSVDSAVKALKDGAYDYISKPVDADEIKLVVNRCLEQRNIFAENEELRKMVRLIEICKNISTTFEKDKISEFALDILMKETNATAGFFIACSDDDKRLEVLSFKGVSAAKNNRMNDDFIELSKKWKKRKLLISHAKKDELNVIKENFKDLEDGIVIKISAKSCTKAIILLLSDAERGNFTPARIKYASFIAKETILAFENLDQYLGAKELAYIDDLTSLYNSRYLYLILDREIKRAKRFKSSLILLFIDLDQFKKVNDTHGHLVGGKVLVEMAEVLTTCVREIDTMVRYGGDEYVVVLTETSVDSGMMIAERIRKSIEDHIFLAKEGLNIKLTACIGVAAYPDHASTKKELIHFADMAMYLGKGSTKNAVYIAKEKLKNK